MSEYPFNLQGRQESFSGSGRKDDETEQSREFSLIQGVVIAEIEHHGYGDFKLRFVPTEGFSEDEATAATIGGGVAAGAATGAAIGSIVPVAGTVLGGLLGGAAGWLAGGAIDDAIAPTIWTPVDDRGKFHTFCIGQVKEDEESALAPGKYRIEVTSKDRWTCRFIQPDLGQSIGPFLDEDDNIDEDSIDAGLYVYGPLESGSKPLLANICHSGRGEFYIAAYSVDGTHLCVVFQDEGQFQVEDHQTEIKPGKEYMLYIFADGAWNLNFTEGY